MLFEPITIKSKRAPNRLWAQSMEINSADAGGGVSPRILDRYAALARGGWGVVSVEAISVTGDSLARTRGLVLNRKNLDGFKRLADAFRAHNGESILIFQLSHAGRQAGVFSRRVKAWGNGDDGIPVLSGDDLAGIGDQFVEAARLAAEAGADGVDIKACHGYLLGELLRPSNTREDAYGGSVANRARLVTDVIAALSRELPALITGSRISLYEGIRGGCGSASADDVVEDLDDILAAAGLVVRAGASFVNVSAGIPSVTPHITRPVKADSFFQFYHYRYAKLVKRAFPECAVVGSAYSAGEERSLAWAYENIRKGYADFSGFGRQTLADPMFPVKAMDASHSIRRCTLCGGCSKLLKDQAEGRCSFYEKE
jgi:2,4-dienoyl-CoA reductase-like NADH-dependent reductase (Old Yellow Enzyme family)